VGLANNITILDGSQESQHNGQTLPYTTTLTDNPPIVGISAQTSSDEDLAAISCEIDRPGQPPVTNKSTGPYAVVNCTSSSIP
jgi:hypothetical protein